MVSSNRKEPEHYKTGYNWGDMHGNEGREKSKSVIPKGVFEKSMEAFAGSLRILNMQINKELYIVGIFEVNPEDEKSSRKKFISESIITARVNHDKDILQEIKTLLSTSNAQRAVDMSLT